MKQISIKGAIVSNDDKLIYDWMDMEASCPKDIERGLNEAAGEPVIVEINSGGGNMFAGSEMYYLLKNYKNSVTADIVGLAGSAATVVCCGAQKVRAVPTAMYMIHNVSTGVSGDYNVMSHTADVLQTANRAVAQAYMQRTGMTEKELLELMDKESWMNAQEAKEKGFIDEIIGDQPVGRIYNAVPFTNTLTPETIEKIRNTIKRPIGDPRNSLSQAKLDLLKLKGEMRHEF